jgi:hypothetical protein
LGISNRKDFEFGTPPHNLENVFSQNNSTICICDFYLARVLLTSPYRFTSWECVDLRVYGIVLCVFLLSEATSALVYISYRVSGELQDHSDFLLDLVIAGSE